MWLEVKGGPRDQAGCTGGTITFCYPHRYVDLLGNSSIAYYTATWDPASNTIKDSITGGAMFLLGAAEGDPLPSRVWVIEELQFSDGTTRRQTFWVRILANETGLEWDYNVPEAGYQVYDGGTLQLALAGLQAQIDALTGGSYVADWPDITGKPSYLAQAEIPFSFTADGEVIYIAQYAMTLVDVLTEGTGTLTYSKKVGSGGAWSAPGALPASLAAGDRLKIIAADVAGTFGGNIQGTYT